MDILFKIYVLLIAATIGMTISIILAFLFFKINPTPLLIVATASNWVLMIKLNPVWQELWEKWTSKK
ncbi:hypothetical protein LCM00_13665 [Bacillus infantis]|uniref:hypothetical protein n=1 Tax=Bacillus infantis TaxID=324767 RepID=UPI001CD6E18F|nr:hypothetical protein [Bacillus infantis]MCA1040554.1 hypothetical protein [Bacillus infantis]